MGDPADKARHDKMVALVVRMLELNKRRGGSRTAQGASRRAPTAAGGDGATDLEREIAATDAQIDELVYELYSVTDEEWKIIQGS